PARRFVAAMDKLARRSEQPGSADEGLVPALLFDPKYKNVLEDLKVVAHNFRDVSDRLVGGKGTLGGLIKDEPADASIRQASRDLQAALANLREITAKINEGEGTLGALIADPTVYERVVTPALRRRAAHSRSRTSSSRPVTACRRASASSTACSAAASCAARSCCSAGSLAAANASRVTPESLTRRQETTFRSRRYAIAEHRCSPSTRIRCFFTHRPFRSFTSEASVQSSMSLRGWGGGCAAHR